MHPSNSTDELTRGDLLYGTHVVLNTLRVFAAGIAASSSSSSSFHPHRERIKVMYIRDFSQEKEADEKDAAGESASLKRVPSQYKSLHRLLALSKAVRAALVERSMSEHSKSVTNAFPIVFVPRAQMRRLCDGDRRHQNAVLITSPFTPHAISSLSQWWRTGEKEAPSNGVLRVLYLDHLLDPVNLGGIFRVAFFYGINHVILSPHCAPCGPAAARSSAGLMDHLNVLASTVPTVRFLREAREWVEEKNAMASPDLTTPPSEGQGDAEAKGGEEGKRKETVDQLKRTACLSSLHIYGTTTVASRAVQQPETLSPAEGSTAVQLIVLGNEREGLSEEVLSCCTHRLHIACPRHSLIKQQQQKKPCAVDGQALGHVDGALVSSRAALMRPSEVSLNVHVASAVILSKFLND